MSLALNGVAVTYGAQTGFTTATGTCTTGRAPDAQSSRFDVTALGGTQAGVRAHSMSDPFSILLRAPKSAKPRPVISADGLIVGNVALNEFQALVTKGCYVYGTNPRNAYADLRVKVPAGADTVDPANIRAMIGFLVGVLNTYSATIGTDAVVGSW